MRTMNNEHLSIQCNGRNIYLCLSADERWTMNDMYGCISIVADLIKWMTNHKPFKCLVSSFLRKGSYEIQPKLTMTPHTNRMELNENWKCLFDFVVVYCNNLCTQRLELPCYV